MSLSATAGAVLPQQDPFTNTNYPDGNRLRPFIDGLRNLDAAKIKELFMAICPPRWGLTVDHLEAAVDFVSSLAKALIEQFDKAYPSGELKLD